MHGFLKRLVRQTNKLDPKELKVILVHSGKRVLERERG